jgi:hypothetical protein
MMRLHAIRWHQPADVSAMLRAAQECEKLGVALTVCPRGTGRWQVIWPKQEGEA